ncbi:MAG TPA: hypothetical protein VD973_11125 [Symbiobacteriaceae bacterium]|nr:hypothetical protein [Symbiobacteriaceae bacterium]
MRHHGRQSLTGILALVATVLAFLLYSVNLDAQAHLKQRLEALATHAGLAEAALREVERDPSEMGERTKAMVHLESLNLGSRSLGQWAGLSVAAGRPGLYPINTLQSGNANTSDLAATRANLAASELALREVAHKRFVRKTDVEQVLKRLETLSSQAAK